MAENRFLNVANKFYHKGKGGGGGGGGQTREPEIKSQ